MDDLHTTRELLMRKLGDAIATDPLGALPTIVALQHDTEQHLREAVQQAALNSSWSEIAGALGVSKQAAHQRFRAYAKDVAQDIRAEHRAMRRARRTGDPQEAARARARREELTTRLRTAARDLKDQA